MVNEALTLLSSEVFAMIPENSRHPRGGLWFEDFPVGTTIAHRLTRTVTQMDNMLFSNMTLNPQPLHIDAHFCATETEWGRPLMNSLFTLGLMIGISVNDTTVGTTIANLGMTDVRFPAPLFEGDTVNVTTEIVGKRESKSRPDAGIVDFIHRAYKQDAHPGGGMPAAGLHAQAAGGVMRSLLFVPGDSARKLEKGLNSGADALIVDLEDSVAPSGKAAARQVAAAFLAEARAQASRPRLFVRVNGLATGLADADLDGVMEAGPDGIMLPKTVGGPDVSHLGSKLAVREAAFGLEDGATRIVAIATETRPGRVRARHARRAQAGACRESPGAAKTSRPTSERRRTGGRTAPTPIPTASRARSRSSAAAAAEVDAIDSVYTNFRDLDGLAAECRHARRDGFVAKMAIHPAQVPVINEAFTPSADAVAWAHSVIDAFAAQPDAGVVGMKGEMLDRPHLKRARAARAADGRCRPTAG